MATRDSTGQPSGTASAAGSRYRRGWVVASVLSATAWIVIAVSQSRPLPLLGLVTMLGAYGGLLAARTSLLGTTGARHYAAGAATAAGLVLVLAGMRYHPAAALGLSAVLGASSPPLLHWVAEGRADVPWVSRHR